MIALSFLLRPWRMRRSTDFSSPSEIAVARYATDEVKMAMAAEGHTPPDRVAWGTNEDEDGNESFGLWWQGLQWKDRNLS